MTRLRQVLRIVFAVHCVGGLLGILALVLASPLSIGASGMAELAEFDWRWVLIVPLIVVWGVPLIAVVTWRRASLAGVEVQRVRELVATLLQNRQIPVLVDVDVRVPVKIDQPMRVPVELNTRIAVDELIDIETMVPIRTVLPLDTDIETSVFGLGKIKIPIKAQLPIDLVLPVVGKIRVKSAGLPVHLKEEVIVQLPQFEVPIKSRLETRIDLLDTLRAAEDRLRKPGLPSGTEP
jgi:hypothetical protein